MKTVSQHLLLIAFTILLHTISVAQNVGIGTTNPLSKLHVEGNGYFNGNVGIGATPSSQRLEVTGNSLFTGSAYITGSLGIGTTSPLANLHITGNDGFLATGTFGSGSALGISGAGAKVIWYPKKAAFRAGYATGTEWNDANIGNYSTAFGYGAKASNANAFASGYLTLASGATSFASGAFSQATDYACTAMGQQATASGQYSVAIGNNVNALADYSTALGHFMSSGTFTGTFLVGDASTFGDVNSTATSTVNDQATFRFKGGYRLFTVSPFINANAGLFITPYVSPSSGSDVGIGTTTPSAKLEVIGVAKATSFTSTSDIRFKTNILPIANALTAVINLHPIYYNWKKDFKGYTDERQIGFSAQEVEKFFPEMVLTDANGYKSIDYSRMTTVLVEAVKEQQGQLQELKNDLSQRDIQLQQQQKDIDVLKQQMNELMKKGK